MFFSGLNVKFSAEITVFSGALDFTAAMPALAVIIPRSTQYLITLFIGENPVS